VNVIVILFAAAMIIVTLSYMVLAEGDQGTIKSPVYRGGITYSTQEILSKFGRNKISKLSRPSTMRVDSLELSPPPLCSGQSTMQHFVKLENDSTSSVTVRDVFADPLCQYSTCPAHSFCFLGMCVCHPGYSSTSDCANRSHPANPWCVLLYLILMSQLLINQSRYTDYCPNLQSDNGNTFDTNTPLHKLGGEYRTFSHLRQLDQQKAECVMKAKEAIAGDSYVHKYCAYLCYSHPAYGVATVPTSLCKYTSEVLKSRIIIVIYCRAGSSDSRGRSVAVGGTVFFGGE